MLFIYKQHNRFRRKAVGHAFYYLCKHVLQKLIFLKSICMCVYICLYMSI